MKLRTLALLTALLAASGINALAIPLSGNVVAVAELQPGTSMNDADVWGGTPENQSVSVTQTSGNSWISSSASTSNVAADGSSGEFALSAAWDLAPGTTMASAEGTYWRYAFIADATGDFVLDYTLSLSGRETFGLNGFYLSSNFGSAFFSSGNTSGQYVGSVTAGNLYNVYMYANANLNGVNLSGFSGQMDGQFSWSLTPGQSVPDSASSAVLLSLSLLGLAAVRRRFVSRS